MKGSDLPDLPVQISFEEVVLLGHRREYENAITREIKVKMESRHLLESMDKTLDELAEWKVKREAAIHIPIEIAE